ncbi:MAG: aldo/keto reductase [Pseudomonadota bacterium]
MKYQNLGRSGLKVSSVCLGAMMFGGRTEFSVAHQIVQIARDAGINFVDTADAYHCGASETMLGTILKDVRAEWIVASKVHNAMGDEPNQRGLSRYHILDACDASLKRLGRDHIDLYYLHKEDPNTPLAETVRAMGHLLDLGKIRYWGVSNYRAWRIAAIIRLCRELGVAEPVASQPLYNCLDRTAEVELLPCCSYFGLGVVPYSPLARGILTGKYSSLGDPDPQTRAGQKDRRMLQTEWRQESLDIARQLRKHAQHQGTTLPAFSIAWLLNNRMIVAPIVGPRTVSQMKAYLEGLEYQFKAEDEAIVDECVAAGHVSTHGYNDPAYPIEGRQSIVGS